MKVLDRLKVELSNQQYFSDEQYTQFFYISFGYNIKTSFFIVCVLFVDICEYRGYSLCTRICHFYGLLQISLCSISIL